MKLYVGAVFAMSRHAVHSSAYATLASSERDANKKAISKATQVYDRSNGYYEHDCNMIELPISLMLQDERIEIK